MTVIEEDSGIEILIENEQGVFAPAVQDGIILSYDRVGSPGQLQFSAILDKIVNIEEGTSVAFNYKHAELFLGYIFSKSISNDGIASFTVYDQIRYFKNTDTYVFENKTASEIIEIVGRDFHLRIGTLEDTVHKIPSLVCDNQSLLDMILKALEITFENTKKKFTLFDSYGKITLMREESLWLDLLIDADTSQSYSYHSTVDSDTYNKIKLIYDNSEAGTRDIFIAKDDSSVAKLGVLQKFESVNKDENGQAKADSLLTIHNTKKKTFSISKVFGDARVMGGSSVMVSFKLVDEEINQMMMVEKVTHSFNNAGHFMDLTLKGGEYTA